jgi:pimeloyl-ACP methyl ester carboxylesterase
MVLLHGIMSSAATWWRIGPALAARGWHMEALDLPAHGDNPRLGRPLTLETLAEGVAAQLTAPADVLAGHRCGETCRPGGRGGGPDAPAGRTARPGQLRRLRRPRPAKPRPRMAA